MDRGISVNSNFTYGRVSSSSPRYRPQDMHIIVSCQTNIIVSRYTFTSTNTNHGWPDTKLFCCITYLRKCLHRRQTVSYKLYHDAYRISKCRIVTPLMISTYIPYTSCTCVCVSFRATVVVWTAYVLVRIHAGSPRPGRTGWWRSVVRNLTNLKSYVLCFFSFA